jgi:hypothetical protein
MWQDDAVQGYLDAKAVGVDYTTILGVLPEEMNGALVYMVEVEGTAVSCFGYSYPVKRTVTVHLDDAEHEEDRKTVVDDATDEEIAQLQAYTRALACKEYTDLVEQRNDQSVSARITELDGQALEEGLHFVPGPNGKSYVLEPASQKEIAAHKKAQAEAEDKEDEE